MNYIILDMEWNQGYPSKGVFIGDTRKILAGEIIQIGAVKLDENFFIKSTYTSLIKPVFYRKMHFKVQELTGISKDMLSEAAPFTEVFPDFIKWCGEEYDFIIWGADDIRILKENIEINKIEGYEMHNWYNLQIIYNSQCKSEHKQSALSTACESLGIAQEKQLHNALNDAFYTAEICRRLDMKSGLALCRESQKNSDENCKRKYRYYDFGSAKEALEYSSSCDNICPICKRPLVIQGGDYSRKYYNQFCAVRECSEHGFYFENIVVAKSGECAGSKYKAVKTVQRMPDYETALKNMKAKKNRRKSNRSVNV